MRTIKFQIWDLLGIGMTLIVVGIAMAFGMQVMGETRGDMCEDQDFSYDSGSGVCFTNGTHTQVAGTDQAFNSTESAIDGVAKIPEKLPTIATVIVAAVILGILITYLWQRFK